MYEYFAGCDTHKEQHTIAIINHFGKLIESFEIENTSTGWTLALKKIQNYSSIIFGVENSANYAKLFSKYLIKNSIPVKEVNPIFTGKRRKAHTCYNKTDEIDAVVIAKITRDEADYLPDVQVNSFQEILIAISKQRNELVKEQTRIKNRLHSKLTQFDTQYKKKYGSIQTRKFIELLKQDYDENESIESFLLIQDVKLLENIRNKVEILENKLKEIENQSSLIRNLITFDGINTVSACTLVGLIGNISRFNDNNKLASYAGVQPVVKESGKYSKKYRNIGGNRRLNAVMYRIALTQIAQKKEGRKYYEKKLGEGKTKKQAMHCLMRRIVKILFQMYKNNQPYNYDKIKNSPVEILQAA